MHAATLLIGTFVVFVAMTARGEAQTLVEDFNTTAATGLNHSSPQGFTALPSGELVFSASTPETGSELWISDGTIGGTRLLADIRNGLQGSAPFGFLSLPNGLILFEVFFQTGSSELWKTDGTTAGTLKVTDLPPDPSFWSQNSRFNHAVAIGNEAFFITDSMASQGALWKSDGTAAGTVVVTDLSSLPAVAPYTGIVMAKLNASQALFTVYTSSGWELRITDGTPSGTTPIFTFLGSIYNEIRPLTPLGAKTLFCAPTVGVGQTIWVTDATAGGTFSLGVVCYGPIEVVGATGYFIGYDPVTGAELWKTDGTIAGTALVQDLLPGTSPLVTADPRMMGSIGNNLVVAATPNGTDFYLYLSDGTVAGMSIFYDLGAQSQYSNHEAFPLAGGIIFNRTTNPNADLWFTDGTTAGTIALSDLEFHCSTSAGFQGANGVALYGAGGPSPIGHELWTTDGTPAGTQLFLDIAPNPISAGSDPIIVTKLRDKALVTADDGPSSRNIYATDGTTAGTHMLANLPPSSTNPPEMFAASTDSFALFSPANAISGDDPWITDGTASGTQRLPLAAIFPGFQAFDMTPFGNRVLFAAATISNGRELWITDGTIGGTSMVDDLNPGWPSSNPADFYVWQGRAYFSASGTSGLSTPWVTDGTAAGTTMLSSTPLASNPAESATFVGFGDHVYYSSSDAATLGAEIWRTDGTPGGTFLFGDMTPGAGSSLPSNFVALEDRMVFAADRNGLRELHWTDGAQITLLGSGVGDVYGPHRLSDELAVLFRLTPGSGTSTIATFWKTDATFGGTVSLGIFEHFSDTDILQPKSVTDDQVVFLGGTLLDGHHLWSADGTAAGTRVVIPEIRSTTFFNPTRLGDRMLFTADSSIYGTELFTIPLSEFEDEVVDTFGFGVTGTNGVPTISVEGEADASATNVFEVVVANALPSSATLLVWSRGTAAITLPDVTIWTGGLRHLIVGSTDASGRAAFPVVPNFGLAGQRFVSQAFVLDPLGAAFGAASATQGLEVVVGP